MEDRFGYGEIGLDIHPCRGCEDYDESDGCKSNGGCGKPITNADKIRSMTDEELADLLHHWWLGDTDYFKTFCFECKGKYTCHDDCLIDWLKQEVKE